MSAISIWIWPLISLAQNHRCRDVGKDFTLFSNPPLNPGEQQPCHLSILCCSLPGFGRHHLWDRIQGSFTAPNSHKSLQKDDPKLFQRADCTFSVVAWLDRGHLFSQRSAYRVWMKSSDPTVLPLGRTPNSKSQTLPPLCLCGEQMSKDKAKQQLWICLALFYPNQWTQKGKKPHTTYPQTHSLFPYHC